MDRRLTDIKNSWYLFSLIDARAKENDVIQESIDENYPNLKFK
jgi:chromosome partitioning protein